MTTVIVGKLSYNRNDIIGNGSFGNVVHRGFYLSKQVAIKRMQRVYGVDKYGKDKSAIQLREVELMEKTNDHPNILSIIHTEKNDDFLYIATELCRGTLEDYVKKKYKGPRLESERDVLFQITQGLAYLHSLEIVHRDMKPANILIFVPDGTGSKPVMKLADFGISKMLEADKNDFTNTSVTNPNGTKGYMPPEVYKEERFGFKVDVWALGCIFAYTLCKGKHPFGEDVITRIDLIRKEKAMLMEKEDLKASYYLDSQAFAAIKFMLITDPSKRPTVENVLKHPFLIDEEERPKYFKELWNSFKDSVTNDQKVQLEKMLPEDEMGREIGGQNTPFHILCKHCDNDDLIDLIKILIEKGADTNAENIFGETPLHSLCENKFKSNQNFNRTDTFHLLIENSGDVNAKNIICERTPLHLLFKNEKKNDLVDIFRFLREKGADIMAKDIFWDTPLHFLCRNKENDNMIDHIKLLAEKSKYGEGADVNAKNHPGETPLHLLCEYYQSDDLKDILKFLIKERNANVNAKNNKRSTPFHYLCSYNQKDNLMSAIQALIHEGAQVNAKDDRNRAPLHLLCEKHGNNNLIESVQLLIEEKADVNATDNNGLTPLHYLCKHRYKNDNLIAVFQLFIQKNVDVNVKDKDGNTPLHVLCEYYEHDNLINIVQLLVQNGAEVNAIGKYGDTPLHSLCEKYTNDNLINIAQFFLENGAGVNVKDEDGNTPLHLLCSNYEKDNLINIVQLLVDNGAEVNIRDNNGNTPLHEVLRNSAKFSEAIIQILLNRGADVNAENTDGWTPLHSLCGHYKNDNLMDIVQLLINNDARVNPQDNDGDTPLHFLCLYNHIGTDGNDLMNLMDIVVLFEKYGASMGATNNEGITPNDFLNRRNQLINMLAMEPTNQVAIDVPTNPITKDEDTTECPTNTAKSTEVLPAQEPLAGLSSAHDGEFIRSGTSRKKKRSNHSVAKVHQNSKTVPPVPAQLEPAVLPSMVSETASLTPYLNAQHFGPSNEVRIIEPPSSQPVINQTHDGTDIQ